MILTFIWPSSAQYGGGVATMYEYANAMARRGHEVHLVHGPKTSDRVDDVAEIAWFTFDRSIEHHIVDDLDDITLVRGDVCFPPGAPDRLGEPAVLIQGYKMIAASFERSAFRSPCPKICVASWLVDVGVAWGSPPDQMFHAPLGIDHEVFTTDRGQHDRPIDVAMLYSIHPLKGGDMGMKALSEVHRRRPDLRVELFGIIKPEGEIPPWAHYRLGSNQATLVKDVYARSKVFVQPSRREGFGLTALEAMACGCALATTDCGGSRDYAMPGETALVVPPADPMALADAVEALLADTELRRNLATAGQRHSRRFTWERSAEILEGHLQRYLADPTHYQTPPRPAPIFLDDSW